MATLPLAIGRAAADQCGPAIAAAEARHRLPPGLLLAVAEVESGRPDPSNGAIQPWPWTTNANNQGQFFGSREAAVAWVRDQVALGFASIDVGCLQVNLKQHPDAFVSLEQAFDPARNAEYAASFLVRLRAMSADWTEAVGWYHSHTPALAEPYRVHVARSYLDDARRPGRAFAAQVMARRQQILQQLADAWSATLPAPVPARVLGPIVTTGSAPLRPSQLKLPSGVVRQATPADPGRTWTDAAEHVWDAATPGGAPAPRSVGSAPQIAALDPGVP